MITARQHALLDDALTVGWDLTEVIAERSAELMAEAVFTRHRPTRRVWPPTRLRH